MGPRQGLVYVNYQDLRIYQQRTEGAFKQIGSSSGKIIYLSASSQMLLGFSCITLGVLTLVRCEQPDMRIGIWSGVMYLLCGIVGLAAAGKTDYTVVMCYLVASVMSLSIAITALCLEGQRLTQTMVDGITFECVAYSSSLLSFSSVETTTAVTAVIISFIMGKGTLSQMLLPDLQVYIDTPGDTATEKVPPAMAKKAFALNPSNGGSYRQPFL